MGAQVVLKFQNGAAVVPLRELRVTESSESVLAGTKRPPFRLVVRAIKPDGRRLNIRPAVSEEFVVRARSSWAGAHASYAGQQHASCSGSSVLLCPP